MKYDIRNQVHSLYQKVRKTRDEPNINRYAKIHVLFHELAILKLNLDVENDYDMWFKVVNKSLKGSINVKQFWKDFFSIKTLTELSNERLHEIENFLEKKIEYEYKHKFIII